MPKGGTKFDYQSDQHCAKTAQASTKVFSRLITSQINTAPKLINNQADAGESLITSQINTAPKLVGVGRPLGVGLITSQINTAPKHEALREQIRIAPKWLLAAP